MIGQTKIATSIVTAGGKNAHEDALLSCLADALVRQDEIFETLRECDPADVEPLMPGQYVSGEIMERLEWHHRLERVQPESSNIVPFGASSWALVDVKSNPEESETKLEMRFSEHAKAAEICIAVDNVFQDVSDLLYPSADRNSETTVIELRAKTMSLGFAGTSDGQVIIFLETY